MHNQFRELLKYGAVFLDTLNPLEVVKLIEYVQNKREQEEIFRVQTLMLNPQLPTNWNGYQNLNESNSALRLLKEYEGRGAKKAFQKSPQELKTNGSAGGRKKGDNKYKQFLDFVVANKINVLEYNTSENLSITLKSKGLGISKSTAGKYLERFKKENTK
jgi:hypothetical protein